MSYTKLDDEDKEGPNQYRILTADADGKQIFRYAYRRWNEREVASAERFAKEYDEKGAAVIDRALEDQ